VAEAKPFTHALIVGKFAPLHRGHQYLIDCALRESDQVTVLVYANPDFTAMPQAMRAAWLQEIYPELTVLQPQDPPPDTADDATHREYVRHFLIDNHLQIDAVFTSENYGDGFAQHLGVLHRLIDKARIAVPVSGTKVRQDVHAQRGFLHPTVYRSFVRKIVIMGAESTGKSTLAAALAQRFDTSYVAEYGREHHAQRGGVLTLDDYLVIAREHQRLEDEASLEANRFLFIDTNAITTLAFSYYYNGAALPELHQIARACIHHYDLWLVCNDDIPFEQDGWRDTEALRTTMQRMILYDLNERGIRYHLISGDLERRIETVAALIENSGGDISARG
jgi:NadR type nicotinamide-nucleotide adenylyltransferase